MEILGEFLFLLLPQLPFQGHKLWRLLMVFHSHSSVQLLFVCVSCFQSGDIFFHQVPYIPAW